MNLRRMLPPQAPAQESADIDPKPSLVIPTYAGMSG